MYSFSLQKKLAWHILKVSLVNDLIQIELFCEQIFLFCIKGEDLVFALFNKWMQIVNINLYLAVISLNFLGIGLT